MYRYMHIYIYVYLCIHTYTHTHTYTLHTSPHFAVIIASHCCRNSYNTRNFPALAASLSLSHTHTHARLHPFILSLSIYTHTYIYTCVHTYYTSSRSAATLASRCCSDSCNTRISPAVAASTRATAASHSAVARKLASSFSREICAVSSVRESWALRAASRASCAVA